MQPTRIGPRPKQQSGTAVHDLQGGSGRLRGVWVPFGVAVRVHTGFMDCRLESLDAETAFAERRHRVGIGVDTFHHVEA